MPEKTHAEVPTAFFEYQAFYEEPIFDLTSSYAEAVRALFGAFRPWNVSLENVSCKQKPLNLGQVSTLFGLLNGRAVFTFGIGASSLSVTNPNWSEADMIIKMARAGREAIEASARTHIEKQRASIAMHVKPTAGSIKEFVSGLARFEASRLAGADVHAYGISVYRETSAWVVDASALYADALFVKVVQTQGGEVPLEKIAAALRADEMDILDLLALEVG